MLKEPISITAIASISSLGDSLEKIWNSYLNDNHNLSKTRIGEQYVWASPLPENTISKIEALKNSNDTYKNLDESVLFAIFSARKAIDSAGWRGTVDFGINIGSSRGATSLFEKYHEEFLKRGKSSTLSSPTTTLGNISSWVAHDLKSKGPEISHSITCSTALHALLNGIAWIQSGMTAKFLVGGSEAPLTPFTIAQMQALKIYAPFDSAQGKNLIASTLLSSQGDNPKQDNEVAERSRSTGTENKVAERSRSYPCQALNFNKKKNSMVLGEGAAMACLESGKQSNALALIQGIGYATEPLKHNVSISTDAQCFQQSMKMALGSLSPEDVDVIVMHSPGTVKGDLSELKAIEKVFCKKLPFLTTNKWKVGHTFGASGMLSIEMAILMLQYQKHIQPPLYQQEVKKESIQRVMVNAVGFGGNAVSVLLSKWTP
ncbi:Beta-ketoacyl-[acyl-carrier-protein] synthase II [Flagellimonas maritima]|uniref:Beta-ketoacyl-[acyl-carrier-protein] synthase II n=1 Tax=Flagellimonas maritima TaxID=1383885 RepID=A0A2Z4LR09_9FLAO|nr:beta-ketoacyl synthase N-terminal-like domain-containing protein [Allomuricauda aurantiaca]AWX44192.1 Beta-ketoacyl-[acyl-carrier-protein] synthase II [Allomuricauda aurantiaca]